MPRKHLTQRAIDSLKVKGKPEIFWDSSFSISGGSFGVRVFPTGAKKYYLNYRNRHGQQRRMSLGDASKNSLANARKLAREKIVQVDAGEDPVKEKATRRKAETFSELCELYIERHAKPNKKPRSVREDTRIINHDLLPNWANFKVQDITRRDIIGLIDSIQIDRNAPTQAKRTRALISKIFNFAVQMDIIETSPVNNLPVISKDKPRTRVLDDKEIKLLFTWLDNEPLHISSVYKLVLLTAQRPGEVSAMEWSEIRDGKWKIPAKKAKNGKEHSIPLSSLVLDILHSMKAYNDKKKYAKKELSSKFVFASPRSSTGHMQWFSKCNERINKESGIKKHFSLHDLRRTTATKLREIGTDKITIDKVLNHSVSGDVTLAHYQHYNEFVEMKRAFEKFDRYILRITENG